MKIDLEKLSISTFDSQYIEKKHLPLSTSFKEIEILFDGSVLIREDYYNYDYYGNSNIYRIDRNLNIKWFLETPNATLSKKDRYVSLKAVGNKFFAHSWDGYKVEFDFTTGEIQNKWFTK